ncbi:MAG: hypothetical protein JSU95_09870 [Betaproteobacteria bacterium]|nr:MAG: hypothetical protein JSU95_09870 [Betaproteobacteria bacterium]
MSRIIMVLAIMFMATPAVAAGKDKALTLYGGYRDGGRFTDEISGQRLEVEGSGAVSLAYDFAKDASRAYQIFLSHQRSDLSLKNVPAATSESIGMNITYLHIGGTNFWQSRLGKGWYVVGGLGATFFDPGEGFDSELRASGNLGFGYEQPLGKTFGLRFEARGYATLVNSSGGFFCSGGCIVSISGEVFTQGELMLGLSARF